MYRIVRPNAERISEVIIELRDIETYINAIKIDIDIKPEIEKKWKQFFIDIITNLSLTQDDFDDFRKFIIDNKILDYEEIYYHFEKIISMELKKQIRGIYNKYVTEYYLINIKINMRHSLHIISKYIQREYNKLIVQKDAQIENMSLNRFMFRFNDILGNKLSVPINSLDLLNVFISKKIKTTLSDTIQFDKKSLQEMSDKYKLNKSIVADQIKSYRDSGSLFDVSSGIKTNLFMLLHIFQNVFRGMRNGMYLDIINKEQFDNKISIYFHDFELIKVFYEILDNIKYSGRDNVGIKVEIDDSIRLLISNNGKEIPNTENIFNKFFTENSEKYGLGLYLVKEKYLNKYNANIEVLNSNPKNTTFQITFKKIEE